MSALKLSRLIAPRTDPVQSLLAVGTTEGRLFVFGESGVELSWDIGRPLKIKHLAFKAGSGFLCLVGECLVALSLGLAPR